MGRRGRRHSELFLTELGSNRQNDCERQRQEAAERGRAGDGEDGSGLDCRVSEE